MYYHASKRRKIPLPPAWPAASMSGSHAVDAGSRGMAISRTTPADIITPERLRRSPIMITSSPNSRSQYQTTVSPGTASSTSPLSLERTAPRFDFGRNIDTANRLVNASNGLQRVTGTSQFILPSESANDNQDSTATLANLNLALLFSPQKYRRYQYAPGGMAATVRDWVLDTAVGASVTETVSSFSIRSIKLGQGGSRSVLGIDKLGEKQRYLLFGDPQDSSVTQIKVGDMIAIMNPTWTIELDHPWTVVVKWKLVGKVPS